MMRHASKFPNLSERMALVMVALAMLAMVVFVGCSTRAIGNPDARSAPSCAQACNHICDTCNAFCGPPELQDCIVECTAENPSEELLGCILDTDLCDDIVLCDPDGA